MKREFIWPAVVLACAALVGVVILTALHTNPETIMLALGVVVTPLLVAFVGGQVSQVQHQTNGNTSELLALVRRQSDVIANLPALTPAPVPVDTTGASSSPAADTGPPATSVAA